MYLPLPRVWSKRLALVMIALGILLLPDIIAPTPLMDVFLNVPLAMVIADVWGFTYLNAFMMTYVISFMLLLGGLAIYPYNTKRLISGRLKASVYFIMRNPLLVALALIGLLLTYIVGQWAYDNLYEYAKTIIMEAI